MALPPGPRAPTIVQTVQLLRNPVPFMEAARREFGETFTARVARIGNIVFITDPPSIKALYSADRDNIVAPGRNAILEPLLGPRSLLLVNDSEHLSRRKLMLPPFHGERMRAYEEAMEEAAQREVHRWPVGEEFSLHPHMQAITLDVIMRAVFGVTEEHRDDLRERLLLILSATQSPLALALSLEWARRLGAFRRVRQAIAETDEILATEIAQRRADPELESREDILSMLVSARDENGEGMSNSELRDQLITLLMAGHETTATALAWSFDLLFRNPEAMERLLTEIEGEDHDYLDAVAEEALRLRPVVMFAGRQLRKPMELGGYELDRGTVVGASMYLAHTREDVFPEPYSFRPERFLEEGPDTYSWIPFGGGTRRCLGAAFAQFEMRVVLRTILRLVDLRPATDEPEEMMRRNVTLSPRKGTPAIVTGRRERRQPQVAAA
jgi:cytochrome P450